MKKNKEVCYICGKPKVVDARDGIKPVCGNCHRKRNKEICYICGEFKVVVTRNNKGEPICKSCWFKGPKPRFAKYQENAKRRGILWELSFDQFYSFWQAHALIVVDL